MNSIDLGSTSFADAIREGLAKAGLNSMKTREKLTRWLHNGKFHEVSTELAKYGILIASCSWYEDEGRYAGHNKSIVFHHLGLEWVLESVEEEIVTMGYSPITKELAINSRK